MTVPEKNRVNALLFGLILLIPLSLQLKPVAIPVGSFYITLVEAIIIFLIAFWPIQQRLKPIQKIHHTYFGRYVFSLMTIFAVYLLFGMIYYGPILALGDFRQYMPLYLFFPMVTYFRNGQDLEILRKTVFVVLIIVASYSIIIFAFFNDQLGAIAVKQGMRVLGERIYMVNSLSVLFAYLGYVTARLFNPGASFKVKAICLTIISLNGLMVLIMQSRSLWVMFAMILLLSIFSLKNHIIRLKFVFIGGYTFIFIIAVAYLSANVFGYTPSIVKRLQSNVVDRLVSFTELDMVGQHASKKKSASIGTLETRLETAKRVIRYHIIPSILIGSGFGSQIPMVDSRGNVFSWKYQIDNAYLTILAKFGLLGFAAYFLLTFKVVQCLFRIIHSPNVKDGDAMLAKSFIYMIFAVSIGSMTSSIFIRQQPLIIGFLIMLSETERMAATYLTSQRS